MKNQVSGPNININLNNAIFKNGTNGVLDMGSLLLPGNSSDIHGSKISNQEARVLII